MTGKALVIGDDTNAFLAAVRSLGRSGVEVHAISNSQPTPALRSRYIERIHRAPDYDQNPEAWEDRICSIADETDVDLLVPTSDTALHCLKKLIDRCGRSRLALPNPEAFVFTDKAATRKLAAANGVPIPDGRTVTPGENPEKLTRRFGLPLILKPSRSVDLDEAHSKRHVTLAKNHRQIQDVIEEEAGSSLLAEQFIPGYCRGLSILAWHGEVQYAFQHRRIFQSAPTGPSSRRVSEAVDPALLEHTRRLAEATGLHGVAMFEFRHDTDTGENYLLETNPRLWGSLPLALTAGMDFPVALYKMFVQQEKPDCRMTYRPGVVKVSLHGEYDRLASGYEAASGIAAKGAFLVRALWASRDVLSGRRCDSWAADDRAPFRAERKQMFDYLRSALTKRSTALRKLQQLSTTAK